MSGNIFDMEPTSVNPDRAVEFVELTAMVSGLAAEVHRLRGLDDEVARLRAQLDAASALAVTPAESATAPLTSRPQKVEPAMIGRRGALRKAGTLAAGAVVGSAAVVAASASPAAASTVTGSGSPGVAASGVGGDGISATTDTAQKSGIFAFTSTAGAFGAYAQHVDGTALHAQSSPTGAHRTAEIVSTNTGTALYAKSNGTAAELWGGGSTSSTVRMFANSTAPTAYVQNNGTGPALFVDAGGDGISVQATGIGLDVSGSDLGAHLFGLRAALLLGSSSGSPPGSSTVAHTEGELYSQAGDLWYCTDPGTPGRWVMVAGSATAGALTVLPAPIRVYDSRPGTFPAVAPKTPLSPGVARTLDLKANNSTVPAGATAAVLTVLLVNAASGNGNATVWANGVARPQSNTLVWGGSTGRFTAKELTALDSEAQIQVLASLSTDVVVDVVGYYR